MRQFRWIGLSAAVALVALTLLILAVTPTASAKGGPKHKIKWSSDRVGAEVQPGEVVHATVSFTSPVPLANVSFRLSDSVAEMVTVLPASIPAVVADTENQIEITFTAPAEGDRRKFNGTLKVVDESKSYAKPLKLRFGIAKPPEE